MSQEENQQEQLHQEEQQSAAPPPGPSMGSRFAVATHVITSTATLEAAATQAAIATLREDLASLPLLGIDVEWRSDSPLPAVVQLATRRVCFVVSVTNDSTLLEFARGVLADASVVKAGVGVKSDKTKIELIGYEVAGEVDLAALVCRAPEANEVPTMSLANITLQFTQHQLNKDLSLVCSNWEAAEELSPAQLDYAADDAIAGFFSFEAIMTRHEALLPPPPRQNAAAADAGGGAAATAAAPDEPRPEEAASATSPTTSRRTPAQFAKQFLKRKVLLKKPPKSPAKKSGGGAAVTEQQPSQKQFQSPSQAQLSLDRVRDNGVRCLDVSGKELFYADVQKAHWYIKKGIATVTEVDPSDAKRVVTIQLKFEPARKTKCCRSWHLGSCTRGHLCPFAHGAEELVEDATAVGDGGGEGGADAAGGGAASSATTLTPVVSTAADEQPTSPATGIRLLCDMCRAGRAGNAPFSCVPSPWLRLMGPALTEATGAGGSHSLHCCCKCSALLRSIANSERSLLRRDAERFVAENILEGNDDENQQPQQEGENNNNNNNNNNGEADEEEQEDGNDDDNAPRKTREQLELELLSKISAGSITRICSHCFLLYHKERLRAIPAERVDEMLANIAMFCEQLLREDFITEEQIAAAAASESAARAIAEEFPNLSSEQELLPQQRQQDDGDAGAAADATLKQQIKLRAYKCAALLNHYQKSDWLAVAEARDIARFFCLKPFDDTETSAKYDFPARRPEWVALRESLLAECRGARSVDVLRVSRPEVARMWATRIFIYYSTMIENQLKPVIVPWKSVKQQLMASAGSGGGDGADCENGCCICCTSLREIAAREGKK